jgi:hypothetical protein
MASMIGEGKRVCQRRTSDRSYRFRISGLRGRFVFFERDGELGFAGSGSVVEGGAGAVAFGNLKEEPLFGFGRQAGEAGFAVGISADFEIELVSTEGSVGDVDFDVGGVDGLAGIVSDGEVGGAGADAAIDDGNGVRTGSLSVKCRQSE